MTPDRAVPRWQASIGNGGTGGTDSNQLSVPADSSSTNSTSNPAGTQEQKSVLLVDSHAESRETRAKAMRSMGMRVETAAGPQDARARLATETYNLVVVDVGRNVAAARSLGNAIQAKNPRQRIGYLVGSPRFITTSLGEDPARPSRALPADAVAPVEPLPAANASTDFGQRIREVEAKANTEPPA